MEFLRRLEVWMEKFRRLDREAVWAERDLVVRVARA